MSCHRTGRLLRPVVVLLLMGLGVSALVAPAARAVERPLVYVVVFDGLDGDRVDAGRLPFTASLLRGEGARATYYRESRGVLKCPA